LDFDKKVPPPHHPSLNSATCHNLPGPYSTTRELWGIILITIAVMLCKFSTNLYAKSHLVPGTRYHLSDTCFWYLVPGTWYQVPAAGTLNVAFNYGWSSLEPTISPLVPALGLDSLVQAQLNFSA